MPKIHFDPHSSRTDVYTASVVRCGVYNDRFFGRGRLATGDHAKVTCARCNETGVRRGGRKPTGRALVTPTRAQLRAILAANDRLQTVVSADAVNISGTILKALSDLDWAIRAIAP